MSKEKIKLNSEKINKRESRIKVLKLGLLISTVFLIVIFFLLKVVYGQGPFTISLDQNFAKKSGIIIYEDKEVKESRRILEAEKKEFIDNKVNEKIKNEIVELDKIEADIIKYGEKKANKKSEILGEQTNKAKRETFR